MASRDITRSAANKDRRDTEKWLERALCDHVAECGGIAIKMLASSITGLPDRLILWPGGVAEFVELKSKGARATKIQKIIHTRLRSLGFGVWLIDRYDALNIWKNSTLGRTKPRL